MGEQHETMRKTKHPAIARFVADLPLIAYQQICIPNWLPLSYPAAPNQSRTLLPIPPRRDQPYLQRSACGATFRVQLTLLRLSHYFFLAAFMEVSSRITRSRRLAARFS